MRFGKGFFLLLLQAFVFCANGGNLYQSPGGGILIVGVLFLLFSLAFGLIGYFIATRHSLKRAGELFNALPGRVGIMNRQEKILHLAAEVPSEMDLRKTKCLHDIPDIDYPKLSAAFAGVFRTGQRTSLEYEYGNTRRFMTIAPLAPHIYGEDAIIWFSHDNSELQKARKQAQNYAAQLKKNTRMWDILINSLPVHIFAKDAGNEFRYVFTNRARSKFFHLPVEELNGKNDFDLMPPETAARLRRDDECNMADIDRSEESLIDIRDHDGNVHRMRAVQTPFIDEDGTHLLLGAMLDVTDLHNALLDTQKQKRRAEESARNLKHTMELWEQEVTRSSQEKQTILDNINIPIWLHDGKGELLRANTAVEKIAGIPLTELDTCRNREIFNGGLPAGSELPLDVVIRTKQPVRGSVVYNGRDYLLHLHPVLNGCGELAYIIKSAIDVTELNALIQTQKLISYCLETFFTQSDPDKALALVTKAVCKYMKASRCFVMKFNSQTQKADIINEYVSEGCRPDFNEIRGRNFNAEEPWYQSFRNRELISWADTHAAGAERFFGIWYPVVSGMKSLHVSGIYLNGKFWGDIGIGYDDRHYDFSEREKNFIRTIARMLELLLERKKAQELILESLKRAQDADKAKGFFIASVSHEIRTPLNAVIGLAELLQDGNVTPEDQKDYLESIAYSGNTLLQLINDVLDLSKLEADQMQIINESTRFAELALEIKQIFTYRALEGHLVLNLKIPALPELELDKLRIRQILFNLVGNAVKFTKKGAVTVWAEYHPDDSDTGTFRFGVTDTGIGISSEDQKKLMEPFVQVSKLRGTNAANNGTGLGLSICKRLAEKMNGTLRLESAPGEGSSFFITLYHTKISKAVGEKASIHSAAQNPERVNRDLSLLLVDDVEMNLKVMKAMCSKLGIRNICCVKSGEEALEQMKNRTFNLVLTDMWMSGMNGTALAEKIHQSEGFSSIPIFAVTADAEIPGSFSLKEFSGVLLKPITMEKMLKMLNTAGSLILQNGSDCHFAARS